jgi:hypothetical protein
MRVAVIVVTMVVATVPSRASEACMSQAEARRHFPTLHLYWRGPDHCWDATPAQGHRIDRVQRRARVRDVEREIDPPKTNQPNINQAMWRDSMSAILPDDGLAQLLGPRRDRNDAAAGARWEDRWVDIEQSSLGARWVDIAQVEPTPIIESKPAPMVMLRSALLVLFAFTLTLATIEVLFRRSIDERPRSTEDTEPET